MNEKMRKDSFQHRKGRKDNYTIISQKLLQSPYLSLAQFRIYACLSSFKGYNEIFPSFAKIIDLTGLHKSTVIKVIAELEEMKLLTVERNRTTKNGGFTSNRYILEDYEDWEDEKIQNLPKNLLGEII